MNTDESATSFTKKLLSWKYLLTLVLTQGVLLYTYMIASQNAKPSGLGLLILGVSYFISRRVSVDAQGEKVRSWQWVSFIIYMLITIVLGIGIFYITTRPA